MAHWEVVYMCVTSYNVSQMKWGLRKIKVSLGASENYPNILKIFVTFLTHSKQYSQSSYYNLVKRRETP